MHTHTTHAGTRTEKSALVHGNEAHTQPSFCRFLVVSFTVLSKKKQERKVLLFKAAQIPQRFCKQSLLNTTLSLLSLFYTRLFTHSKVPVDAGGSNTAIYSNFKSLDLHTFKEKILSVFLI